MNETFIRIGEGLTSQHGLRSLVADIVVDWIINIYNTATNQGREIGVDYVLKLE